MTQSLEGPGRKLQLLGAGPALPIARRSSPRRCLPRQPLLQRGPGRLAARLRGAWAFGAATRVPSCPVSWELSLSLWTRRPPTNSLVGRPRRGNQGSWQPGFRPLGWAGPRGVAAACDRQRARLPRGPNSGRPASAIWLRSSPAARDTPRVLPCAKKPSRSLLDSNATRAPWGKQVGGPGDCSKLGFEDGAGVGGCKEMPA